MLGSYCKERGHVSCTDIGKNFCHIVNECKAESLVSSHVCKKRRVYQPNDYMGREHPWKETQNLVLLSLPLRNRTKRLGQEFTLPPNLLTLSEFFNQVHVLLCWLQEKRTSLGISMPAGRRVSLPHAEACPALHVSQRFNPLQRAKVQGEENKVIHANQNST